LSFIDRVFTFRRTKDPLNLFKNVRLFVLLRPMNKDIKNLKEKSYVKINDPSHNCKELAYYVRPGDQIKQLIDLGFKRIAVISLKGNEIKNKNRLDSPLDVWLYYFRQT